MVKADSIAFTDNIYESSNACFLGIRRLVCYIELLNQWKYFSKSKPFNSELQYEVRLQVIVGVLSVYLATEQCAVCLIMSVKVMWGYPHVRMNGKMYSALKLSIRIILFPFCRRNVTWCHINSLTESDLAYCTGLSVAIVHILVQN